MLNPEQQAAVKYIDGPLLVLAGAGSGKTRVIIKKIHHLIEACQYSAKSIYAVTFTNKAANEMRQRINQEIIFTKRKGLKIATFHTLGLMMIKKHPHLCGLKPKFSIFDSEDSLQILRSLLSVGKAQDKDYLQELQRSISLWKNNLLKPEATLTIQAEHGAMYKRYQQALRSYNAVDFDDLINLPVHLLKEHPEVQALWQYKIKYMLVDEYQDSNHSQYELLKLLTHGNFTVVGDDDQSVYAWRGARPENLIQLQEDYPKLKLIKLEQNYRSTQKILHIANRLIGHNPHLFEKKLWSQLAPGEALKIIYCQDEQDEAEQVVMRIMSHKFHHNACYKDYAILYRNNHQARLFEKALRQQSIQYTMSGGQSFFAKTEVKDIFAYLKLLSNPEDNAAFLRIINTPKRGIGEQTLKILSDYAHSRHQSLYQSMDDLALNSQLSDKPRHQLKLFKDWLESIKHRLIDSQDTVAILATLIEESGYESYVYEQTDNPTKAQKKMANVWELIEWIGRILTKKASSHLQDAVNQLILMDILEKDELLHQDTLQMMTLHAAKGLEFPHVYLVGLEEGLLPHRVSIDNDQIEEERRLLYVGITRAQRTINLTLAQKRFRAKEWQDCEPSRFIEELPADSVEFYGQKDKQDPALTKQSAVLHLTNLKKLLTT